jgi:hypothetical protein
LMTTPTPPSPASVAAEPAARREAWVDNLRVVVVTGVIGSHVSVIYALDVGWWYEERTASGLAQAVLAGVFAPGLLFAMGLLFFVAGLFTPPALEHKGARRFVVDRLWRLGIPTAAYLFVVNPALNFFGARAMGEGETVYWDDVETSKKPVGIVGDSDSDPSEYRQNQADDSGVAAGAPQLERQALGQPATFPGEDAEREHRRHLRVLPQVRCPCQISA